VSAHALYGAPGVDFDLTDVRGEFPPEIEIQPLERPPDVTVTVPGSKSVTNRVLLVAALADGRSRVANPLFSDDSFHLMRALVELGFDVRVAGDTVEIEGRAGTLPRSGVDLFVGNAGTVARFLPPALALGSGPYVVDGEPRMRERPIGELVDALRDLGAGVAYAGEEGHFPIRVAGGGIAGGATAVPGARSSQFLSGLLLAAPYAKNPVTLQVRGELVSRPYVGITLDVMRAFGVNPKVSDDLSTFHIESNVYEPREYAVEPDASAASYFMAAAAVTGGRIRVEGLASGSNQGDLRFAEVLRQMGCEVDLAPDHVRVRGPGTLRGVTVDMNEFSDTMMTLAAIAPFANGPTHITGIAHTRLQETDRVSAVAAELARLGVTVTETHDSLHIIPKTHNGGGVIRPATVRTYGDHRMAMAFAVTGLVASGVSISDPACVTKTFPRYFDTLAALR
jgi:3-phosphoshikimate 1-carboxyvinyltransferase